VTKAFSYLRMSTDLQLKGDSRRRQLEASRAYAEAHGLTVAEDAQLEDIGVSAFRGDNVRDGALGRFLEAVKRGAVEPGSYLLVESLDRLSREQVMTAHATFLSIVQAGINVVTLMDGKVYRAGQTDLVDLITSLVIMNTAHEESRKKSVRVAAAWKNKRALAATGIPMTARCPGWLRLSPDRRRYEPVPDRVEIVRQIFADYVAGVGMYSIARRLNRANVPPFMGKNGWHQSSVKKILQSRAVIGEFQPCTGRDGQRIPDGEPIKSFYPAAIDKELFYQAQAVILSRVSSRGQGAGRKGPTYGNLFNGLARCAYCRSSIYYENKGESAKGGIYIVCSDAKRHRGCPATRWRYRDFEASFLSFVKELDIDSMINEDSEAQRRRDLEGQIGAIEGELSAVQALMQRTYELLSTGAAIDFVSGELRKLEGRQVELKGLLDLKTKELELLKGRVLNFYRSKEEVRAFVDRLQARDGEALFRLRAQIAARLKTLVETLVVAPLGHRPKTERLIQYLRGEPMGADVVAYLREQLASRIDDRPYFAVGFRNGTVRAVYPNADDPLTYDQQVLANREGFAIDEKTLDDQSHELVNFELGDSWLKQGASASDRL
jgi:DNA invertase Pin-like site-specific DNA recombinase